MFFSLRERAKMCTGRVDTGMINAQAIANCLQTSSKKSRDRMKRSFVVRLDEGLRAVPMEPAIVSFAKMLARLKEH
jgi:hypothetical protein